MAKGQHLSAHQRGIVKRYYEHMDSLVAQKLSELVSEVYLATGTKQQEKLWRSVEAALAKSPVPPEKAAQVVSARDIKGLAQIVADLAPGGRLTR